MSKSLTMGNLSGMFRQVYANTSLNMSTGYAGQGTLFGISSVVFKTTCGSVSILSDDSAREIMAIALKWSDVKNG